MYCQEEWYLESFEIIDVEKTIGNWLINFFLCEKEKISQVNLKSVNRAIISEFSDLKI